MEVIRLSAMDLPDLFEFLVFNLDSLLWICATFQVFIWSAGKSPQNIGRRTEVRANPKILQVVEVVVAQTVQSANCYPTSNTGFGFALALALSVLQRISMSLHVLYDIFHTSSSFQCVWVCDYLKKIIYIIRIFFIIFNYLFISHAYNILHHKKQYNIFHKKFSNNFLSKYKNPLNPIQ